jgi:HK97 gp10 family phage protein
MASSSSRDIAAELEAKVRKDAELRLKSKDEAEKVCDEIRAETPKRTGAAAASVHVEKRKDRDGLPHWWVGTRLWYFHFLEFGTGPDNPDSKSPFGPDTPTKEYAPFAKVAHRHGGTTDGIEVDG